MKQLALISTFLLITAMVEAQVNKKGDMIVSYSIGGSFSNFLNSEAPHKINIFGSDIIPASFASSDLTKSFAYADYKTGIFKDILCGVTMNFQLEYFLKEDLSVMSGVSYELKGINLHYSNTDTHYTPPGGILAETFKLKTSNDYLTIPLLFQKYISKNKSIYVSGGIYTGYLISSRINYSLRKTVSDQSGLISDYLFRIDKQDTKKEYSHNVDFGFSLGAGYVKKLSNRILLKTGMLINLGIRQVDGKYHNEFSVIPVPSGANFVNYLVRSTNYYGLNSSAKNINLLLTVGLGCRLGK